MKEIRIKKIYLWQGLSILLIILIIISFLTNGFKVFNLISKEEAKERVINFLNTALAGKGQPTITDLKEEKGLYMLNINLNGQQFNSYLSKDGSLFFPSVIVLDKLDNNLYNKEINKSQ